jgi:hypothetical protein
MLIYSCQFLGDTGDRTIFQLQCSRAVDIARYSAIPTEAEVVVPPGLVFEIVGRLNVGHGLWIITLQQDEDAPAMVL